MTTGSRIAPLGDRAFLIELATAVSREAHDRVMAVQQALSQQALPGLREIVPAYTTLGVWFDPETTDATTFRTALEAVLRAPPPGPVSISQRSWTVPVVYDGPDLTEVAERTGLTTADVVARHAARTYEVYFLGFVPGFAFLGELDPRLELPRRVPPRRRVPPGAVAIAGRQTAIYPLATPGGWHLLGRTTFPLFDPAREPPALLTPGDQVRFAVADA